MRLKIMLPGNPLRQPDFLIALECHMHPGKKPMLASSDRDLVSYCKYSK